MKMNNKVRTYKDEELLQLGESSIALLTEFLFSSKDSLLKEFSHGVARLDYKEEIKNKIQFQKEFDDQNDYDYILFHLVMFSTTLLKYNAPSYIMKKKLFGGYLQDPIGSFSFVKGLENGLMKFKQVDRLRNIREIIAVKNDSGIYYSYGKPVTESSIPYFYFEFSRKDLSEITMDFAENIAYLRNPKYPNIAIGVFNEKAKEIVPLAHAVLRKYFVE